MSRAKSGGGLTSNKLVRPSIRGGSPTANRVNVTAVSQLGAKIGNHSDKGTVKLTPQPLVAAKMPAVALGNSLATNVGKGGPGAGRKIFGSGSQGSH